MPERRKPQHRPGARRSACSRSPRQGTRRRWVPEEPRSRQWAQGPRWWVQAELEPEHSWMAGREPRCLAQEEPGRSWLAEVAEEPRWLGRVALGSASSSAGPGIPSCRWWCKQKL